MNVHECVCIVFKNRSKESSILTFLVLPDCGNKSQTALLDPTPVTLNLNCRDKPKIESVPPDCKTDTLPIYTVLIRQVHELIMRQVACELKPYYSLNDLYRLTILGINIVWALCPVSVLL